MNRKGFTLIEMIFCISVILIILLLVIPNVTNKNSIVKDKGCEAQIEVNANKERLRLIFLKKNFISVQTL